MSITQQHTQEALTEAYVHALSGMAGLNLSLGPRHDYGTDGVLRAVKIVGNRRVESGVVVDFQLKSTTNWTSTPTDIVYDLEVKNYNDLVTREAGTPTFVLILLCMPKDAAHWLGAAENALTLKHCCYWTELRGPASTNRVSRRIRIPRSNLLTPNAMRTLIATSRTRMLGSVA